MLGYTGALSMLTAFLFGLAPAVRAARANSREILKAHTRSVTGGGLRLPRVLVSVQIALCLTAVVAAGLLGRSLEKLKLDRCRLRPATTSPTRPSVPSRAGYPVERLGPYVDRVRDEIAGPRCRQREPVATRLLSGGGNNGRVNLPGRPWSDTIAPT